MSLVVLTVLLAPTARSYFQQRAQIAQLESTVAAQRDSVAELTAQQKRWQDPAYVEQQARSRLKFVKQGETAYTLLDADPTQPAPAIAEVTTRTGPWYARMWGSVEVADRGGVPSTP